jgi:penicillin amidase
MFDYGCIASGFRSDREALGVVKIGTELKGGRSMNKKLFATFLTILLLAVSPLIVAVHAEHSSHVSIERDNYGVPHVFANTKEGLAFGAGYAVAQDRLWQADLYRRQSFGNLAEFGLATIDQDYQTRMTGYSREELKEIYDKWVPINPEARLKEMTKAYVDGINYYISEALGAYQKGDPSLMPLEYLPGVIKPGGLPLKPFAIEDAVSIVVMMAWKFGGTGGNELMYAAALDALQKKYDSVTGMNIFNDLYPRNDPGAEVTIPAREKRHPEWEHLWEYKHIFPSNISEIYKEHDRVKKDLEELYKRLGLPTKFGSNAWMVVPRKSETGNALLQGGPQMGQSIPQIVLEIGLHGAGINAVGMMMPHMPSILIGVSEHGAWTSTTGSSDVIDTYIEVLKPGDATKYWYKGQWHDMEVRTEKICDYSGTCADKKIYRTIHGPVISSDSVYAYTIKLPYYKNELAGEEGWSLFQQATNIWEFQEAVKTIQPSHNFYWIDRLGNIAFWHAGTYPIKPTYGKDGRVVDPRLPLWGTGEEEWVGLTGFEEMPKSINPKQGSLANWNNKPIANWPYAESDYGWGEGHRVKRIQELLAASAMFSFEDMNRINMDAGYNHIPGMNFLHYLVEAAKTDSTVPAEVVKYLEAWNYHYNDVKAPKYPDPKATYDDPGLTIFDAWYGKIKSEVFGNDLPLGVSVSDSTLIHVLDGPNSKLPLNYDYLNGENRNKVIVKVLKAALADLTAKYGPDISTWLTPIRTQKFSQLGALPAPTMHYMNRGTYNQIAEMPRGWKGFMQPHAVNVVPPGQSGFTGLVNGAPKPSPHAYDQLPLYETWTYKPMLFRHEDLSKVTESWMFLNYP